MKSTGEVLGIGKNLEEALYKGLVAAGYNMNKTRRRPGHCARQRQTRNRGCCAQILLSWASPSTPPKARPKLLEAVRTERSACGQNQRRRCRTTPFPSWKSGKISYVISTDSKGRLPQLDSVKMRRKTVELGIPCLTSLDTANALARSLLSRYSQETTELVDLNRMRKTPSETASLPKWRATGNDYIYFDCMQYEIPSPESISVILSDRHFGIGGDGIILILPSSRRRTPKCGSSTATAAEGKMCGNGIRCVAKYLYEHNIVRKNRMTIETLSGVRQLHLYIQNGQCDFRGSGYGQSASWIRLRFPYKLEGDVIVNRPIDVDGAEYRITCISMGNPHCVTFMDNVDTLDIAKVGPEFELHPLFPDRVNTEFVQVLNRASLKMRVWERGSGETWACGTGACAAAVAAVLNGYCSYDQDITVHLKGGTVIIRYQNDGTVIMTGDAKTVFQGSVEL